MRIFKTLIFSAAFCGLTACSADAVDAQVISQETSQTEVSQVVSDIAPQLELAPNWTMRADESSIVFKGKQTGDEFSGDVRERIKCNSVTINTGHDDGSH